jgi:site-specific DNA-methyltransferase (adenine-specific)
MLKQLKRVTKPDGAIVLTSQSPFDKVLGCSNLSMLRYEWIWEKTNATGHLNAKKMPMKAHENILVFYDKLPTYNPQKTSGHVRKQSLCKKVCTSDNYGLQKVAVGYDSTERYPRDVLVFPMDKQKSKLHSTQKPVALMEYLVKTYTDVGATVLDFSMGSGTTGVAAKQLGRSFIGIEIDDHYFNVATKRINEAQLKGETIDN